MIKVVASIELDNGRKKTCSFQTKENRQICLEDLSKVCKFIDESLLNGYKPYIFWKITYDQRNVHLVVSSMSSNFIIISHDRAIRLLNNMISSINNNLGNKM